MCLAIPGKIVDINDDIATVDYGNIKKKGKIIEGNYSAGDFVIVQGGCIITKLSGKEASEALELYKKMAIL